MKSTLVCTRALSSSKLSPNRAQPRQLPSSSGLDVCDSTKETMQKDSAQFAQCRALEITRKKDPNNGEIIYRGLYRYSYTRNT